MFFISRNNKGMVLHIAMFIVLLLTIVSVLVLLTVYNYANITENQIKRERAIILAEAGINYASWKLRTDPFYTGSTIDPGSDGRNVVITVSGGPLPNRCIIQSKVTY
jgi:Tfp pilus assembly protein PilX